MKKILIYSLSIMVVAGAAISCKKTSKGKMSNDWQLESWSETTTHTDDEGDKSVTTREASGSSYKETESDTPNGGSTTTTVRSGTLNNFSLTIEKDGNWSREFAYTMTYTEEQGGVDYTYVEDIQITESGTWNFLGNVDEFKKNERVVFNTLNSQQVTDETISYEIGGQMTTNTDTYTNTYKYEDGDMADIMVVVESKRKELQMKSEEKTVVNNSSNSVNYNTDTYTMNTEVSLSQE
ncbi:MAG: hypothetical protein WED10_14340 [Brumimicrobium sp.]